MTYVLEYESDDFVDINGVFLAPGGDFSGLLNDGTNPFQSLPELKGNVFTRFTYESHMFNVVARYVDGYDDADSNFLNPASDPSVYTPGLASIDDHWTLDLHYNTVLFDDFFLSLSIMNVTDEDPPQAMTDLNYDPYQHSPFGRMIKLGVRYTFNQ
jgi:outer membrane receptor protein involved in Fe transport